MASLPFKANCFLYFIELEGNIEYYKHHNSWINGMPKVNGRNQLRTRVDPTTVPTKLSHMIYRERFCTFEGKIQCHPLLFSVSLFYTDVTVHVILQYLRTVINYDRDHHIISTLQYSELTLFFLISIAFLSLETNGQKLSNSKFFFSYPACRVWIELWRISLYSNFACLSCWSRTRFPASFLFIIVKVLNFPSLNWTLTSINPI